MKQAYEYLYYKVYDFIITINPKNTIASWSALCFVALLDFALIFTTSIVLHLYLGFDLYVYLTKNIVLMFGCLIIVLNYFLLYHKLKYKAIQKKFSKEDEQQSKRGNALVLIVVLGVFISMFYFGSILRAEFNHNQQDKIEQIHFK